MNHPKNNANSNGGSECREEAKAVCRVFQMSLGEAFAGMTILAALLGMILAWPRWSPAIGFVALFIVAKYARRRWPAAATDGPRGSRVWLFFEGVMGGVVDGALALLLIQFLFCAIVGIPFDVLMHLKVSVICGLGLGLLFPRFFRKFYMPLPI